MIDVLAASRPIAQGVGPEDIQNLTDAVDVSSITARDGAIAFGLLVGGVLLAIVVGSIVRRLLRKVPGLPEEATHLIPRATRALFVLIGIALALNQLGVDVGWFTVVIALVAVMVVLMIRPLVENGAAGLLIQSRPSFTIGDDIESNGHRGEVTDINSRTTVLKTLDRRRVHIPNTDVLDNVIVVYTAFDQRRSDLDLDIEYRADVEEVLRLLEAAATAAAGVHDEPAPRALLEGFGTATFTVSLRWWHGARLTEDARTLDSVSREVKRALDHAGIALPSPEVNVRRSDSA